MTSATLPRGLDRITSAAAPARRGARRQRRSIIAFGYYHIDLWDGFEKRCCNHEYFGGREILLWETHPPLESRE